MQAFVRSFLTATLVSMLLSCVGCTSDDDPVRTRCVVPVGTSPTRGPADAWVTIVEFSDFECPFCGKAQPIIAQIDAERPGLRWVFKHMPLTMLHAHALEASFAAECAKEQGKFWEMHDVLFANQGALAETSLVSYAEELGLDLTVWNTCRAADETRKRIAADYHLGLDVGVGGTPTFYINGAVLPGAYPAEDFLELIDVAEKAAKASGIPAADYYGSIEVPGCTAG